MNLKLLSQPVFLQKKAKGSRLNLILAGCIFQYWKAVTQWPLEALQAMSSSKEELKTQRTACSPETCFVHAMEEMRGLKEGDPVQESLAITSYSRR